VKLVVYIQDKIVKLEDRQWYCYKFNGKLYISTRKSSLRGGITVDIKGIHDIPDILNELEALK
jgi:hypothetical protein